MYSLHVIQYQMTKLMALVNSCNLSNDHVAGISCLSSVVVKDDIQIVDSGATDHITPYEHVLRKVKVLKTPHIVLMQNGDRVPVTRAGICDLSDSIKLYAVLLVPQIKFNLVSVAKLASDSTMVVRFIDKDCVLQGLSDQTAEGTGKLVDGL